MILTDKDQQTITKFRQWMIAKLGVNIPFDCRVHNDCHGNTLINLGEMHLSNDGYEWYLMPIDSLEFIKGKTLEDCLLGGLQYAIERAFIKSYT